MDFSKLIDLLKDPSVRGFFLVVLLIIYAVPISMLGATWYWSTHELTAAIAQQSNTCREETKACGELATKVDFLLGSYNRR